MILSRVILAPPERRERQRRARGRSLSVESVRRAKVKGQRGDLEKPHSSPPSRRSPRTKRRGSRCSNPVVSRRLGGMDLSFLKPPPDYLARMNFSRGLLRPPEESSSFRFGPEATLGAPPLPCDDPKNGPHRYTAAKKRKKIIIGNAITANVISNNFSISWGITPYKSAFNQDRLAR
jgi:hypothetical protein